MAGPLIKEGIKAAGKLIKRGRKSKRGRPKKKVEVVEKKVVKREDPRKIKKGKGESDAAFKKRKAAINKLIRESNKETAKDISIPKTSAGRRDKLGRLLSKHLPPERKDISKAAFRRLVKSNLIGVTSKGKTKNIGKYAITPEEIMEQWYGRYKTLSKDELQELAAKGMQIKSKGGIVKRKTGGAIGVGKALRGYGKGYK